MAAIGGVFNWDDVMQYTKAEWDDVMHAYTKAFYHEFCLLLGTHNSKVEEHVSQELFYQRDPRTAKQLPVNC